MLEGRIQVDHSTDAHDDHANSLALAAALAVGAGKEPEWHVFEFDEPLPEPSLDSRLSEEERLSALAQAEQRANEEARALDEQQCRHLLQEGWRRL